MPRKVTPHLLDALEEYQANRASFVASSTLANDQSVLRRFCEAVGNPRVHMLTPEPTEAWFSDLAMRQAPSSYNKVKSRLSNFFDFCSRRGWLTVDLLAEVRPRRTPRRRRLHLARAELLDLIEATESPRDRGILATAANTGLRGGDLTRLRVEDVDLAGGYLFTTIQKTAGVDRLPITADLDRELRAWLTHYTHEVVQKLGRRLAGTDYLFPAMTPPIWRRPNRTLSLTMELGDLVPTRQLYKPHTIVHRALRRIGIDDTQSEGFHTIRRSVGEIVFRRASEAGWDGALRITSSMLGHKSTQTTELYLDLDEDRHRRDELLQGQAFLEATPTREVLPLRVQGYG